MLYLKQDEKEFLLKEGEFYCKKITEIHEEISKIIDKRNIFEKDIYPLELLKDALNTAKEKLKNVDYQLYLANI